MSSARARAISALRSTLRSSRARATPRVFATGRTQLAVGRRYASGRGEHSGPSSDLPWMLGAVVVTVPACYFLWPTSKPVKHHGNAAEHGEHEGNGDKAPQEDTPAEEAPTEEGESTQQQAEEKDAEANEDTTDKQEEAKEDEQAAKPSGSQGESQPKAPDANKQSSPSETEEDQGPKEGGGNVDGVQFKGRMKEDSEGKGDARKREPDSKGGFKKRIDSGQQKNLGGGEQQYDDPEGESPRKESSQTAKPPLKGRAGEMSSKQFGISNTPTRHSGQIDQSPEKSKKPEGGPDTAKAMGPIDPNRPQV